MKKKTLVIGASTNKNRYSNLAIRSLRKQGHLVETISLREGKVLDVQLNTEQKNFKNIHTITLYINPKRQPEYYAYIINLNPTRVIFNPGTENPEFYALLKKHNIIVEVACTLVLLSTDQY